MSQNSQHFLKFVQTNAKKSKMYPDCVHHFRKQSFEIELLEISTQTLNCMLHFVAMGINDVWTITVNEFLSFYFFALKSFKNLQNIVKQDESNTPCTSLGMPP